ncbi:unnamed protein product [Strongylus vulgaris]|uniref:Uncharacterized protein n=1 Tax=Strongylus vulgaris TaxID=40348 RepID=A0A3P7J9R7_STRVU|nr:unnamed protein product [Strongylus vulgaris]
MSNNSSPQKGDSCEISEPLNSSDSTRTDGESAYFDPALDSSLLEGYVGVEAKEPNLAAKPEKPVLRKPGQPPRLRVRKRVNEGKGDKGDMGTFGYVIKTDLPTHLTDDSDSDSPIVYRDDEPVHSRHVIATSLHEDEEDEEDVPIRSNFTEARDLLTLAKVDPFRHKVTITNFYIEG